MRPVGTVGLACPPPERVRKTGPARAKRPEQLTENLADVDLELTERDLAELDAVSALPVECPGWIQADHSDRFPSRAPSPRGVDPDTVVGRRTGS